eukprot:SRR837773.7832.p1 GENE.SRR837773.7832~~SRR837773.7832.p1  ORF type:complete len:135 (-),score=13.84 SRR837773.7832:58-462(-)
MQVLCVGRCCFHCIDRPSRHHALHGRACDGGGQGGRRVELDGGRHPRHVRGAAAGEAIVTSWRFKDWAAGVASKVTITLTPSGADACVLKLKQTGIPETDGHGNGNVEVTVKNGWKGFIFEAIKARLGFGMEAM